MSERLRAKGLEAQAARPGGQVRHFLSNTSSETALCGRTGVGSMVFMNTRLKTNNEILRDLVEASGLTQAVALTIFNRGLGAARYSESGWKAFFCDPQGPRFRQLKDELLEHAEQEFGKLGKAS